MFLIPTSDASLRVICPESIDLGCNPKKIPKPKPNKVTYFTDCRNAEVTHVRDVESEDGCKRYIRRIYLVLWYRRRNSLTN